MKHYRTLAALAAVVTLAACADTTPTAPALSGTETATAARAVGTTTLITTVTGTATNALGLVGVFTGTEQITSFATNSAGDLVANVLVTGTAVIGGITTTITQTAVVPVTTTGVCPILALDLGAIHLDVLGLVVDLAPVNLDIVAESGPGKLLGNLLCAVVNLLNSGASGTALTNLLGLLNNLLG